MRIRVRLKTTLLEYPGAEFDLEVGEDVPGSLLHGGQLWTYMGVIDLQPPVDPARQDLAVPIHGFELEVPFSTEGKAYVPRLFEPADVEVELHKARAENADVAGQLARARFGALLGALGLTREGLSGLAAVSSSQVESWLAGKSIPGPRQWAALKAAFKKYRLEPLAAHLRLIEAAYQESHRAQQPQ